jgi:catechol 2,3-dioxygenase-like lactoylglutathione lyase family enzyme
MTVKRMDNVGIVVEDIDAAIEFFTELGLELEGRAPVEGDWADGVTGLRAMRVEIAMMRTPDGHGRLELSRFLAPAVVDDHRNAPVNALGYLRVMFAVEDLDDTLARLGKRGAELVGEVVEYEETYRLCYIRGPKESSSGSPNSSVASNESLQLTPWISATDRRQELGFAETRRIPSCHISSAVVQRIVAQVAFSASVGRSMASTAQASTARSALISAGRSRPSSRPSLRPASVRDVGPRGSPSEDSLDGMLPLRSGSLRSSKLVALAARGRVPPTAARREAEWD